MIIEEKREALIKYCGASCCDDECVLRIADYWDHEHAEGCLALFKASDKEIEEAYEMIASLPDPAANPVPESATIKDSGDRTAFESGAVRDMHEGKGRCDLMPLDVIAACYKFAFSEENAAYLVFNSLSEFVASGKVSYLLNALNFEVPFGGYSAMFLEVAKHFEEGAKKYGENNWQKGIPVRSYIDSAVRHFLKWIRGDDDERHDRAFCWNIMCAIWTCMHKPELNDYLRKETESC